MWKDAKVLFERNFYRTCSTLPWACSRASGQVHYWLYSAQQCRREPWTQFSIPAFRLCTSTFASTTVSRTRPRRSLQKEMSIRRSDFEVADRLGRLKCPIEYPSSFLLHRWYIVDWNETENYRRLSCYQKTVENCKTLDSGQSFCLSRNSSTYTL